MVIPTEWLTLNAPTRRFSNLTKLGAPPQFSTIAEKKAAATAAAVATATSAPTGAAATVAAATAATTNLEPTAAGVKG